MRWVGMGTRDELPGALVARYDRAGRLDEGRISTEFAMVSGYRRKHAARLLRGESEAADRHPGLSVELRRRCP